MGEAGIESERNKSYSCTHPVKPTARCHGLRRYVYKKSMRWKESICIFTLCLPSCPSSDLQLSLLSSHLWKSSSNQKPKQCLTHLILTRLMYTITSCLRYTSMVRLHILIHFTCWTNILIQLFVPLAMIHLVGPHQGGLPNPPSTSCPRPAPALPYFPSVPPGW